MGKNSLIKKFLSFSIGSYIAVFIGPEGGFEEEEVRKIEASGFEVITLGKRILRTETAGPALLSNIMIRLEEG